MKKILIINRCNTDNLGDQMISSSVEHLFNQYGEIYHADLCNNDQILDITCDYKYNIYSKLRFKLRRNKLLSCLNLYIDPLYKIARQEKFDLIIIGGGELISNSFSVYLNTWLKVIRKYQSKSKIVLFGVGVTNDINDQNKVLLQYWLGKCNSIYVRDEKSVINLSEQFGVVAKEIPDVVFCNIIPNSFDKEYNLFGVSEYSRIVKHNKFSFSNKEEYYHLCLTSILEIDSVNSLPLYLFYTTHGDYLECLEFNQYCQIKIGKRFSVASISSKETLLDFLKKSQIVSSPRMHGCIIAQLCGAYVVPFLISEKMQSYKNKYIDSRTTLNEFRVQLNNSVNEISQFL